MELGFEGVAQEMPETNYTRPEPLSPHIHTSSQHCMWDPNSIHSPRLSVVHTWKFSEGPSCQARAGSRQCCYGTVSQQQGRNEDLKVQKMSVLAHSEFYNQMQSSLHLPGWEGPNPHKYRSEHGRDSYSQWHGHLSVTCAPLPEYCKLFLDNL